jgi:2-methylisocitrate lyase-like PEP mutase family enzyme
LPNVWDPIGARVLAAKGYPAVATASAAISSSLGFLDGERIERQTMLGVVSRICRVVDVPVTADMESGYAGSVDELDETIIGLLDAGAVGLNVEDGIVEGGPLRPAAEQAERIARIREIAAARGIHLVINARVDSFLSEQYTDRQERIEDVVTRAAVYVRAGADCIYPIGPGDEDTLEQLRGRIPAPLNALATGNAVPLATMAAIGINRVSFGPFIFRSCLRKFADIADALARGGSYESFSRETMPRADIVPYLISEREEDLDRDDRT